MKNQHSLGRGLPMNVYTYYNFRFLNEIFKNYGKLQNFKWCLIELA